MIYETGTGISTLPGSAVFALRIVRVRPVATMVVEDHVEPAPCRTPATLRTSVSARPIVPASPAVMTVAAGLAGAVEAIKAVSMELALVFRTAREKNAKTIVAAAVAEFVAVARPAPQGNA